MMYEWYLMPGKLSKKYNVSWKWKYGGYVTRQKNTGNRFMFKLEYFKNRFIMETFISELLDKKRNFLAIQEFYMCRNGKKS